MNDKERAQFVKSNEAVNKWFTTTYEVVKCGAGMREKRIGIARFVKLNRERIDKVMGVQGER